MDNPNINRKTLPWKDRLDGCSVEELTDSILGDGYHQHGFVYDKANDRIFVTNPAGGMLFLYPDGTWAYDIAPYSD